MKTPKNAVAIYARYSTDRQDARSIDDQLRRCRAYADRNELTVVAEYGDAAQSGAHLDRAQMQKMLTEAQRPGGPPFAAVLVDDLSRLSRDLWDMGQVIFRDLASCGVKLIDVNTGMASDGAGARTMFAAMGMVNDTFLQLVRTETHRGLEGRALSGFWTGGRVYGYRTVKEANPPDPEHPRAVPVVNEQEAEVVRRIFRLYAEGNGHKKIAALLNSEGLPAPYDRDYSKRGGKGWGHSTVRSMLLNVRYVGEWTWNKRQWVRVPGKKAKRALQRGSEEWTSTKRPDLAIIDQPLWDAVQARFGARRSASKGRVHGEGKGVHPLSGLLQCGTCGNRMSIVSSVTKAGRRYPNFGCSARHSKGEEVCANSMTISEVKMNEAVFATIQDLLAKPALAAEFLRGARDGASDRAAQSGQADVESLEREVAEQERRVGRITGAMAQTGYSEALGAQLAKEESALKRAKAELDSATRVRQPPPPVDEGSLAAQMKNLLALVQQAPSKGRAALEGWFGSVTLVPCEEAGERFYEARGELRIQNPALLAKSGVLDRSDCGGRI